MARIGLDVGGTFTDFTVLDENSGTVRYHKVPSTPADPAAAIRTGLSDVLTLFDIDPSSVRFVGHGTTVATNMVVEKRGAKTGLLTTRGFRDLLEIGRQTRPNLYDYSQRNPEPLASRECRHEVTERVRADGSVAVALDLSDVEAAIADLKRSDVGAVAICFLHSYQHPEHEHQARQLIERAMPGAFVSISSDVLPEFREYERLSTTVVNAFVGPRMADYCERLGSDVQDLRIPCEPCTFHSGGGLVSLNAVRSIPVRTCLSGPAAGVVGAAALADAIGERDFVSFDVGGTSTDVSLVKDATPQTTSERLVAGYPVKTPMLDIHVIGAGGGSIAWLDPMGALKVGPQSAGANPGPVAYGIGGTQPTLTDANLCLGRLSPQTLLSGRMQLDADAARQTIEQEIAQPLGLSVEDAADGIVRIAVANMSRAIRSVSTLRGHDLSDFALMAYGGAGPLHASDVAAECGISRVVIPQEPGTMCARGMLLSDISLDFVRSVIRPVDASAWQRVGALFEAMRREGENWLDREGVEQAQRSFLFAIDARYIGQNHEVRVPLSARLPDDPAAFLDAFTTVYRREYGHEIDGRVVEIVNCRLKATGAVEKAPIPRIAADGKVEDAVCGQRQVYFGREAGWIDTQIYDRDRLPGATTLQGPAIIEEMSSTTVIHPGQTATHDPMGNILLSLTG